MYLHSLIISSFRGTSQFDAYGVMVEVDCKAAKRLRRCIKAPVVDSHDSGFE